MSGLITVCFRAPVHVFVPAGKSLRVLDLSRNRPIKNISQLLRDLHGLEVLRISSCGFNLHFRMDVDWIPYHLHRLTELDISGCSLTEVRKRAPLITGRDLSP